MNRRHLALASAFSLLAYAFWVSPDFKEIAAGVAIFLFGMSALEQGFKAFTGGTLERALETFLKPGKRTVVSAKYINDTMIQMPDAGLEAARKELLHLFGNTFDIMALVLHADPVRLRRGEDLPLLAQPPEKVRAIDVDDYYQRRVKPLHGTILDFLARLHTDGPQSRQAFMLRTASQDLLEALKALKHLQKNMARVLFTPFEPLRHEIEHHLQLDKQELAAVLSPAPTGASTSKGAQRT